MVACLWWKSPFADMIMTGFAVGVNRVELLMDE